MTQRWNVLRIASMSLMIGLLSLWLVAPSHAQTMQHVTGTVTYRERIALPAGATVTVQLIDVSLQDVAAPVLAEQRITTTGNQVPFSFDLAYDPAKIQDNMSYAVQASIEANGQLLFRTTQQYVVITRGNPTTVDLVLEHVAGSPEPDATLPHSILGATWKLVGLQRAPGKVQDTTTSAATIMFEAGGRASGSGGCNSFGATYSLSDAQGISFSQIASTLRACVENAANALETEYFATLATVTSYQLDASDRLLLKVGNGDITLIFARATSTPAPVELPETGVYGLPSAFLALLGCVLLLGGLTLRRMYGTRLRS